MEFARQQRNNKDLGLDGKKNPEQLVNYEQEAMPKLQTAEASKDIVIEELIKAPEDLNAPVAPVSVNVVDGSELKAMKKPKQRSRNPNPLTKSVKKDKMSLVKKLALNVDKDPSSVSLEPRDVENSKTNDYDEDPSTFRGKKDPKEILDNIDYDYENDPSTFRGKQKVEFNDYESDPSTFRGKQDPDQGYPEMVDLMRNNK